MNPYLIGSSLVRVFLTHLSVFQGLLSTVRNPGSSVKSRLGALDALALTRLLSGVSPLLTGTDYVNKNKTLILVSLLYPSLIAILFVTFCPEL